MTILVTGGAGFIGSTLVRVLTARGESVRVLDDLSTGKRASLDGTSAELVVGSAADRTLLEQCLGDVSCIVHLAALGSVVRSIDDPSATHAANVDATLAVLDGARASGAHVVFSSSSSVFGSNTESPKRVETWCQPLSPYGASKLAAESYCLSYQHVFGVDVLVFRLFNVYGPGQQPDHRYAAVIPRLASAALNGQVLTIEGDGHQTRDFTHVDDVVRIVDDAIRRRVTANRPVHLGFGRPASVNDIVAELGKHLDCALSVRHLPARVGDMRDTCADPAQLLALFPGASAATPLNQGIGSVLAWLSAQ